MSAILAISALSVSAFAEGEGESTQPIETTTVTTSETVQETTTANTSTVVTTTNQGSPKTGNAPAILAVPIAAVAAAVLIKGSSKK